LTIIVLAESIDFTTCEGAHISKMLTIHDYKRRSEGSCNCIYNYKADTRRWKINIQLLCI